MGYVLYKDISRAETLCYTESEIAALERLCANKGVAFTPRQLGCAYGVLISLVFKSKDPRPMAKGFTKIVVHQERVKIPYYSEKGCYLKKEYVFWVE